VKTEQEIEQMAATLSSQVRLMGLQIEEKGDELLGTSEDYRGKKENITSSSVLARTQARLGALTWVLGDSSWDLSENHWMRLLLE
jgi:hypothetical protein